MANTLTADIYTEPIHYNTTNSQQATPKMRLQNCPNRSNDDASNDDEEYVSTMRLIEIVAFIVFTIVVLLSLGIIKQALHAPDTLNPWFRNMIAPGVEWLRVKFNIDEPARPVKVEQRNMDTVREQNKAFQVEK